MFHKLSSAHWNQIRVMGREKQLHFRPCHYLGLCFLNSTKLVFRNLWIIIPVLIHSAGFEDLTSATEQIADIDYIEHRRLHEMLTQQFKGKIVCLVFLLYIHALRNCFAELSVWKFRWKRYFIHLLVTREIFYLNRHVWKCSAEI